jgi:hypothetical protein
MFMALANGSGGDNPSHTARFHDRAASLGRHSEPFVHDIGFVSGHFPMSLDSR